MTAHLRSQLGRWTRRAVGALVATSVLVAPGRLIAQTPQASFERAQGIEQQLGDSPTADALRKAAKAYENVVLRFPNSGYCDNALWQEAALLERAFDKSADPRDRAEAAKVLNWLAKEYPSSPMVKQAAARAAALTAAAASSTTGGATTPATPANSPIASPVASPSPSPSPVSSPPPAMPPSSGPPVAVVRSISRTALPKGDRLTVELTTEVGYLSDRVPNPDRIYFDFSKTTAASALFEQLKSIQSPLIKGVRVGNPTPGITRVVVELTGAPKYSVFSMYGPFRVVIDLESTSAAPASTPAPSPVAPSPTPTLTVQAAAPAAPVSIPSPTPTPLPAAKASANEPQPIAPASNRRGDYSLSRQLGLRVAKIVIDPGHGGHDPGAIANGVTEAELVLDVALRLEKLLLQMPGVEVVLTRRTNEFVPLEERTAIANREKADLFLSIHANSHNQPSVRGIESYFLNFATNPDAEAVAARENAASVERMGTLPAIVKAITLNNKLEESRELATVLQSSLVKGLSDQPGGSRDLGVKQAPFVVLIGAQMPSVLTEIGFLTNTTEAGLFKLPAPRQQIAQALRDAIVRYQNSLKKVSAAGSDARRE